MADGEVASKQLTQAVFDGLPKYIKSAMINGYGILEYASVPKEQMRVYGRKWYIDFYKPDQYPPVHIDRFTDSSGFMYRGYLACDTRGWQQSAINRI